MNKDWKETLLDCIVGVIIILIPLFLIYVYQNSSPSTDSNIYDFSKEVNEEQYDDTWDNVMIHNFVVKESDEI